MRPIAIVAAALVTAATPALAQEAGAPGAAGVSGPLTGANPGSGYNYDYYGPRANGYYAPGWGNGYGRDYYNDESAGVVEVPVVPYREGPGMIEGRAVAPDYDYDDAPGYRPAYPRSQW